MKNIWFLRTDKDGLCDSFDCTKEYPFIYSAHGVCNVDCKEAERIILESKPLIFPKLTINQKQSRSLVCTIKEELIKCEVIKGNEPGKMRCDLFISYWIAMMEEGDIVLVRNKKQEVFICKITGYIQEEFFDQNGLFQRPVKILKTIPESEVDESLWKRTRGRGTLVRNANSNIKSLVIKYVKDNNLMSIS